VLIYYRKYSPTEKPNAGLPAQSLCFPYNRDAQYQNKLEISSIEPKVFQRLFERGYETASRKQPFDRLRTSGQQAEGSRQELM